MCESIWLGSLIHDLIPLPNKDFQVLRDVRLKLQNRLRGKDMRHDLPLPGVLGPISSIEETAADGDKGVVEGRLQEAVPVAVDCLYRLVVGYADVVRLDPDDRPQLLVHLIYRLVTLALAADGEEPQVGELGGERGRDASEASVCEVIWDNIIQGQCRKSQHCRPGGKNEMEYSHCCSIARLRNEVDVERAEASGVYIRVIEMKLFAGEEPGLAWDEMCQ